MISKPFSPRHLLATVNDVLGKSRVEPDEVRKDVA